MEAINNAAGAPKPVGAYSQAVTAAGLVFCAGQVGLVPETGKMVDGGVLEQARQVLTNLRAVLEATGSGTDKIVMTTIFLANISDAPVVNELYASFVSSTAAPARQTLAVKDLPLGALVEISVIAEQ